MRLTRFAHLCITVLASSMAMGLFPTTAAVAATPSCPEMNDRHFGLHISPKGSEAVFQTIGEYAQTALHWNGTSTTRPIKATFSSTTLVPIPIDPIGNSEVRQILSQLYEIGFFVNLDLSKKFNMYLALPQTQLAFHLNKSASQLSVTSSNSEFINFTITVALENLELKFPTLQICKDIHTTKEGLKKCSGQSNVYASNVGLRVAPKKLTQLVLQGKVDLRQGMDNKISLISSSFVAPTGSHQTNTKAANWDDLEAFSDPETAYNLFVANIQSPLTFSVSGDGMEEGTTSYGFNSEGASKLVGKLLIVNFKKLIGMALPPVEELVQSFIVNLLEQKAVKAQLKYQLSRGQVEQTFETLMTSSLELTENECIDSPPGEKGMAVYQFLAQMISGVSVKSKLARVTNGTTGGQSLFFDNQYLLLTNQDDDQNLEQDHFIPEFAPTVENNCIADPQILLPYVQTQSGLPTPDSYHFALNTSEKTWNAVLANLSSSGIIQGLLKNFTHDSSISLGLPKVRFKRLATSDNSYHGSIYIQSMLYVDFSRVTQNAAIKINGNLNWNFFSKETWNSYLTFYGGEAEKVFGGGKVGGIPIEIRLDMFKDQKVGKMYFYAQSLFDQNGYFKNELDQYSNQKEILSPVLSSIKSKFSDLEAQLNQNHYLDSDLLEQWAWGSLGAQLELTSLNSTNGGQLIAFFKLHHFDASILSTCKVRGGI